MGDISTLIFEDHVGIFSAAIFLLGFVPTLFWVRHKWSVLKPELFPDHSSGDADGTLQHARMAGPERVNLVLAQARTMLEREKPAGAQTAISTLLKLEASPKETAAAIHTLIMYALDTADVSSLLLNINGQHALIIVFPNRHEHAHLLRRYPAFSTGWRHHAEVVRASLAASGDFSEFTAILFFLSPEDGESTLLVSCADSNHILLPATLMQREDQNTTGVTLYDGSVNFSLTS